MGRPGRNLWTETRGGSSHLIALWERPDARPPWNHGVTGLGEVLPTSHFNCCKGIGEPQAASGMEQTDHRISERGGGGRTAAYPPSSHPRGPPSLTPSNKSHAALDSPAQVTASPRRDRPKYGSRYYKERARPHHAPPHLYGEDRTAQNPLPDPQDNTHLLAHVIRVPYSPTRPVLDSLHNTLNQARGASSCNGPNTFSDDVGKSPTTHHTNNHEILWDHEYPIEILNHATRDNREDASLFPQPLWEGVETGTCQPGKNLCMQTKGGSSYLTARWEQSDARPATPLPYDDAHLWEHEPLLIDKIGRTTGDNLEGALLLPQPLWEGVEARTHKPRKTLRSMTQGDPHHTTLCDHPDVRPPWNLGVAGEEVMPPLNLSYSTKTGGVSSARQACARGLTPTVVWTTLMDDVGKTATAPSSLNDYVLPDEQDLPPPHTPHCGYTSEANEPTEQKIWTYHSSLVVTVGATAVLSISTYSCSRPAEPTSPNVTSSNKRTSPPMRYRWDWYPTTGGSSSLYPRQSPYYAVTTCGGRST